MDWGHTLVFFFFSITAHDLLIVQVFNATLKNAFSIENIWSMIIQLL